MTGDSKITLYENLGKGIFTLKQEIKVENNGEIVSMAIDDLDGDDKLDVIYATKMEGKIIWYKNNVIAK